MARIEAFRAWRPRPELAARVASPPYDVLSSDEARAMAADNQLSFLHVNKPEIDLPPGTDVYSPEVYAKGAENLRRLQEDGVFVREAAPAFYLYRQRMGDHVQTGLVAGASIDEYENDRIKKHEHTRRVKEDDRTRHVDALNANTGPVFLTYKARPEIDALVARLTAGAPLYDFVAPDGIQHVLWVVERPQDREALAAAFSSVPALYVADGHHRSAAATRIRTLRREANPKHTGEEAYNFFLAVIFPDREMKILDYNRVVRDLNGLGREALLARIGERFDLAPGEDGRPPAPTAFGMYLDHAWYLLRAKAGSYPATDPVRSLDVAILQDNLLGPVLGIGDPRSDERIDFVGGIRGLAELERLVDSGKWAVAFALHPTSIAQLFAVADAGLVMPPKSTWFEPKLRSGLLVRPLDD
ncbi:MAG: DUF1015 family protein [Thermoanaerobaculales bacterium]|jgi:uncharacterized protein (DUF1015 family)|nr:DUF1015 family protein [Thermoanaerobaculales bacterium]